MKRIFFSMLALSSAFLILSAHAAIDGHDWEIVNTNMLPLVDNGAFRQGIKILGPFSRDVVLQQITVGVSMAPTPWWPNPNGFAEALTFGVVNGAPTPAAFLDPDHQWGPVYTSGGVLFMKNLKTWYNNGGALNQDISVPLYDLPLPAGQTISLVIQYYSATVASDIEMGVTLSYK